MAEIAAVLERLNEWLEERRDAFNEDLSHILLGEDPPSRTRPPAPPPDLEELLRRARPLVQELVALVQQFQWAT
jgi:hypothetical protein